MWLLGSPALAWLGHQLGRAKREMFETGTCLSEGQRTCPVYDPGQWNHTAAAVTMQLYLVANAWLGLEYLPWIQCPFWIESCGWPAVYLVSISSV